METPDLAVGSRGNDSIYVQSMLSDGTATSSQQTTSGNGSLIGFGAAIVAIGDFDGEGIVDLAIGAPQFTFGQARGAIYVSLSRQGGASKSLTRISSAFNGGPNLAMNDFFGTSIGSLGDIDGDGVTDLAVGATGDDTGGTDRGAVYVLFMNANRTVKSSSKIASGLNGGPVLANSVRFGSSIAVLGDIDADGVTDIAVGSTLDDTGGTDRGAIYVLRMNANGTVKASTKIAHSLNGGPTLVNSDQFGYSAAGIGDMNGDSIPDLVVGAPLDRSQWNRQRFRHQRRPRRVRSD